MAKSVRSLNSIIYGDDFDNVSFATGVPQEHHVEQEDLSWFRKLELIITIAQMMQFL